MPTVIRSLSVALGSSIVILLVILAAFAVPWRDVTWGTVTYGIKPTITVTGQAKSQQQNQKASFTAGINIVNDNKDTAVSQANDKINAIIAAAKNFGIKSDDIKTENMSVYQNEETYYEDGRQKVRPGQWRVSNSVNATLRDVTKAGQLTDVLSKAGATNISKSNRKSIGTLISVSEGSGGNTSPVIMAAKGEGMGGGGGADVQPGSATVTKTVTAVFELK
jgi:uncharacterized protein YggE